MIHGVFNAKKKKKILVPYFILLPFSTTFMEVMKRVETARSCIMDESKIYYAFMVSIYAKE